MINLDLNDFVDSNIPNYFCRVLAAEAEANMEAAQPPLFLQFVNLLINDAIYLLDEGLSYMAQLKEQQQQRSDGSWPNVPAGPQRHQREATYQHITMLARFHNLMGRETIRILEMMTTEIKAVFVHSTMVDRVASMLNYFLFHLVGPKKRDFKVKQYVFASCLF
jgi:ubiquitin conjugation factor E4 A